MACFYSQMLKLSPPPTGKSDFAGKSFKDFSSQVNKLLRTQWTRGLVRRCSSAAAWASPCGRSRSQAECRCVHGPPGQEASSGGIRGGQKTFEYIKVNQKQFSICLDYWINAGIRGKSAISLGQRWGTGVRRVKGHLLISLLHVPCVVSGPWCVELREFNFIILDINFSRSAFCFFVLIFLFLIEGIPFPQGSF